jgi:hypothetical protein
MAGRLDQIENLLRPHVGSALLSRCPELVYSVNQILVRFMRTDATLPTLLAQMDSLLFNTIYIGTDRSMVIQLDDGQRVRITSDGIRDLADRALALAYTGKEANSVMQDILFDFAREGSYAAMRDLLARFPLDQFDRSWLTQVLSENNQLT